MANMSRHLIPAWLWAALAAVALVLALALALTERRREPGPSLIYDVSSYEAVDPAKVLFREAERISLNLDTPTALCVRGNGTILVAGQDVIVVLDSSGGELGRFAVEGAPDCLAEGPDGRLYLGMRTRIAVHDPQGKHLQSWQDLGPRAWISSIAVDDEHVFAADAGNKVVYRFDMSGNLLNRIGERDPERDVPGFIVPSPYFDILLDPGGGLWAVNPGKLGFEHYRPDGSLASSWYRPGMEIDEFSGCCNPIHAAYRSDASLVTAEKGINRVKVYAPDTALLGVVATPEMLGTLAETAASFQEEASVRDLAVDNEDRVLVLHGPRRELLIFEELAREIPVSGRSS